VRGGVKMKKLASLFFICSFLLSGCSLPFTEQDGKKTVEYIQLDTPVMSASTNIDNLLLKELKNMSSANSMQFEINLVLQAKQSQVDLEKNISADNSPEEVKDTYLALIDHRIMSYNLFIDAMTKGDGNLLQASIKNHEAKDSELVKKTLDHVNNLLVENGQKQKKSLYK
jgi:hypothetical protein